MIVRFNLFKKTGPIIGRILLKTQDIMVIMGRRFYEAVKTWGEIHLSPILEFL
jgi:hypothetical protein